MLISLRICSRYFWVLAFGSLVASGADDPTAAMYRRAFSKLDSSSSHFEAALEADLLRGKPLEREHLLWLARNGEALKMVRSASRRSRCRFMGDRTKQRTLQSVSRDAVTAGLLIWVSGSRLQARGSTSSAIEEYLVGMRLASHLSQEGNGILLNSSVLVDRMMFHGIWAILNSNPNSRMVKQIRSQCEKLEKNEPDLVVFLEGLESTLMSEAQHAFGVHNGLEGRREAMKFLGKSAPGKSKLRRLWLETVTREVKAFLSKLTEGGAVTHVVELKERLRPVIEAVDRPREELMAELRWEQNAIQDLEDQGAPESSIEGGRKRYLDSFLRVNARMLLGMHLSSIGEYASYWALRKVYRRGLQITCFLLQAKGSDENFAEDLESVTPGNTSRKKLVDPFDGKGLRYEGHGSSFRIWSVGPDLEDQEGKTPQDLSNPMGPGDIVLQYWR
ncbi:MAG: hypothetical protein QF752_09210 [Planctomycetota bacterium]|nr:hypothetical protein [Planctomycetota bacterium]